MIARRKKPWYARFGITAKEAGTLLVALSGLAGWADSRLRASDAKGEADVRYAAAWGFNGALQGKVDSLQARVELLEGRVRILRSGRSLTAPAASDWYGPPAPVRKGGLLSVLGRVIGAPFRLLNG